MVHHDHSTTLSCERLCRFTVQEGAAGQCHLSKSAPITVDEERGVHARAVTGYHNLLASNYVCGKSSATEWKPSRDFHFFTYRQIT